QMQPFSPAILTLDFGTPNRQAAIINLADNTVNSTTNGAARGTYISIYATGQGFVPNAPADGALVQGQFNTPLTPRININGNYLDELNAEAGEPPKSQWVQFSGLSAFPGLWQINVYLPKALSAASQAPIAVVLSGTPSYDFTVGGYRTTIAIK